VLNTYTIIKELRRHAWLTFSIFRQDFTGGQSTSPRGIINRRQNMAKSENHQN